MLKSVSKIRHDPTHESDMFNTIGEMLSHIPKHTIIRNGRITSSLDHHDTPSMRKIDMVHRLDKDFQYHNEFDAEEGVTSNAILRLGVDVDYRPSFDQIKHGKESYEKHMTRWSTPKTKNMLTQAMNKPGHLLNTQMSRHGRRRAGTYTPKFGHTGTDLYVHKNPNNPNNHVNPKSGHSGTDIGNAYLVNTTHIKH